MRGEPAPQEITTAYGKLCWLDGCRLIDEGFNLVATIQQDEKVCTLVVYEYKDGFRFRSQEQVLPFAENMDQARRMATVVLQLIQSGER